MHRVRLLLLISYGLAVTMNEAQALKKRRLTDTYSKRNMVSVPDGRYLLDVQISQISANVDPLPFPIAALL